MQNSDRDLDNSLLGIVQRYRKPLVPLLLDIQESQVPQHKFLDFIKDLECFYLVRNREREQCFGIPFQRFSLLRCWINALHRNNYIALSYTWSPAEYEDQRNGRYKVQTRDKKQFFLSPVRDCIFDRIIKYIHKFHLQLLWIDRHSIRQKQCKQSDCKHRACSQKRAAVQTMDLVYKLSRHPVALLGRPIETKNELHLLVRILGGGLVDKDEKTRTPRLSRRANRLEAGNALRLLDEITRDLWWTRGWTFQENYLAGEEMTLLIRHAPNLEERKQKLGIFDDIPGELCINTVRFSYEATRSCLALQHIQPQMARTTEAISHVLSTTGKYTVLLRRSDSMSPTIITDIERRNLFDPWDRLAIV